MSLDELGSLLVFLTLRSPSGPPCFRCCSCYESVGQPDPNCPATVRDAWNGGMAHVDVYMFPDPHKGNPQGQVQDLVSFLKRNNMTTRTNPTNTYGMVWLDIGMCSH